MSYKIVQAPLSAAVAANGTFTVPYPAGTDAGTFFGAAGHSMLINGKLLQSPKTLGLAFGATDITVTNLSGSELPATSFYLELQEAGGAAITGVKRAVPAAVVQIAIGAPKAAAATGIAAAQAVAAAGNLTLNGSLASNGVAKLDVPRGVQLVSSAVGDTTQTATISGSDEYGNAITETVALNGVTVVFGKKAFKRVESIAISAAAAGNVSAGTSDVLGLPLFLGSAGAVIKEFENAAALTTGTFVAGDAAAPAATTGDARGTYKPAGACDGAKVFRLIVATTDPAYLGAV